MIHDGRLLKSGLQAEDKPGFFDVPPVAGCRHPEHAAPRMLHIPAGKGYRHVCPACGAVSVLYGPEVSL